MSAPVRLGILGAGAVTQQCHLPAAAGLEAVEVTSLYDLESKRAREVAKRFRIPHVATSLADLAGRVDAAIIATPNDTHASFAIELLRAGVHVLCEKPIALTTADLESMLAAAEAADVQLVAGQVRRFSARNRLVRDLLRSGLIGQPLAVTAREGQVGAAMSRTLFALDRRRAGGGVLLDWGSHVLDLLAFWFGPPARLDWYRDNSLGGVESDSAMRVRFGHEGQIDARVLLSRSAAFDELCIVGQHGELKTTLINDSPVVVTVRGESPLELNVTPTSVIEDPFRAQLENFAAAVRGECAAEAQARMVAPTVALIEQCYADRQPLPEPWSIPGQVRA